MGARKWGGKQQIRPAAEGEGRGVRVHEDNQCGERLGGGRHDEGHAGGTRAIPHVGGGAGCPFFLAKYAPQ